MNLSTMHKIVACFTGNLWAQGWSNIMELVIPFANQSSPNVTRELIEQVSAVKA